MGLCRDCRWWVPLADGRGGLLSRDYFGLQLPDGWNACELTLGFAGRVAHRNGQSLAVALGVKRRGGCLATSSDFGCVQFEARP